MPTKIDKDIHALEFGELDWASTSLILMRIRDEELWRPVASSFSDYLRKLGVKTHRKMNTYWRTIGSGEYYQRVQQERPHLKLPALATIGKSVSPENLELVEKIARYAPGAMIDEFLLGLKDGKIGRTRLKNTWDIFRNSLDGTKIGYVRRKEFYKVRTVKKRFVVEALLVTELLKLGPEWCCMVTPEMYKFFSYVRLPVSVLGTDIYLPIDAVAVLQEHRGDDVEIHGVFAASRAEEGGTWNFRDKELAVYRQFLDRSWLAALGPLADELVTKIPGHAGIIEITPSNGPTNFFRIVRKPSPTRADGVNSGMLAKYLLVRPPA